jgi:tRNA(Ser,Leu) C12 N-acetylase TAN1
MSFSSLSDPELFAETLDVKGLGLLEFKNILIEFPNNLQDILREKTHEISYCEKIIPLNGFLKTKKAINYLPEKIKSFLTSITPQDKWKIEIKKRHTSIKDKDIIESIASEVEKGTVNLKDPDWIIHINIVKSWIGFGVFKPEHVISFSKLIAPESR